MGGATSELLMFLLKSKGLNAEIFDLCCQQPDSELTAYYKSEALLGMKLKRGTTYSKAIGEQLKNCPENSASQLTQSTKALFMDK
jgi:hypothetical protein